jgi:hypothetical protein
MRAERRLGQMMAEQPKAQPEQSASGFQTNPLGPMTLAQAGIDKNLAHRALGARPCVVWWPSPNSVAREELWGWAGVLRLGPASALALLNDVRPERLLALPLAQAQAPDRRAHGRAQRRGPSAADRAFAGVGHRGVSHHSSS